MMVFGTVTFASSIVGILSPVLSVVVLWALRELAKKQHMRTDGLEKSISEVEENIGGELKNGIKTVLDKVDDTTTHIASDTARDPAGKQVP